MLASPLETNTKLTIGFVMAGVMNAGRHALVRIYMNLVYTFPPDTIGWIVRLS